LGLDETGSKQAIPGKPARRVGMREKKRGQGAQGKEKPHPSREHDGGRRDTGAEI